MRSAQKVMEIHVVMMHIAALPERILHSSKAEFCCWQQLIKIKLTVKFLLVMFFAFDLKEWWAAETADRNYLVV